MSVVIVYILFLSQQTLFIGMLFIVFYLFSMTEVDAFLMYLYEFFNDELIIHGPWLGFWSFTIV